MRGYGVVQRALRWLAAGLLATIGAVALAAPPIPDSITAPSWDEDGTFDVAWTASTGADNYELERRRNDDSWELLSAAAATQHSEVDIGDADYRYRVRACDTSGCSGWAYRNNVIVSVAIPTGFTVPSWDEDGNFTITWDSVTRAEFYELERRIKGAGDPWEIVYSDTATQYDEFALQAETHEYRLVACTSGNCSLYTAKKTIDVSPATPGQLTAPSWDEDGVFQISWTAIASAQSYELDRKRGSDPWSTIWTGTATTFDEATPISGQYKYRVRACVPGNCSSNSGQKTVTVSPAIPTGLTAPSTDDDGQFTVSWDAVASATYYKLERRLGSSGAFVVIATPSQPTSDESVPEAGAWKYRVRACDAGNCSNKSSTITVTVDAVPALAPPGLGIVYPAGFAGDAMVTVAPDPASDQWSLERDSGSGFVEIASGAYGGSGIVSTTDTGLPEGPHSYRARGCNTAECSAWSSVQSIVVEYPPAPPSTIDAAPDPAPGGDFTVSWSSVPGTSITYNLRRIGGGDDTWSVIYSGAATSWDAQAWSTGYYTLEVQACNSAGCGDWSVSENIEVADANSATPNPAAPLAPQLEPLPDSSSANASAQIGATAGDFMVGPAGNALYTVPIQTAPGTAGFAPTLSFDYSSDAGDGPLGRGWAVGGLSTITRCRQSWEIDQHQDGIRHDARDRYCLDGQRLVLQDPTDTYGDPGTVYRTEIDSFQRITAVGGDADSGPLSFEVENPDGSTSEYGTGTALLAASNDPSVRVLWAISKRTDVVGNTIDYHWDATQGTGELLIDSITFEDSAAVVDFHWVDRPIADRRSAWVAGAEFKTTQRLHRVTSERGNAQLREYRLSYEEPLPHQRSHLKSITECAEGVCLNPTVFDWSLPERTFTAASGINSFQDTPVINAVPLDFTGDGRMDLVYLEGGSDHHIRAAKDTGNGFQASACNAQLDLPHGGTSPPWHVIDIDRDGYDDVVMPANGYWSVWRGNGNCLDAREAILELPLSSVSQDALFADISGDGIPDVIDGDEVRYGQPTTPRITFGAPYTMTFQTPPLFDDFVIIGMGAVKFLSMGDVDGDGLADVNLQWNGTRECALDGEFPCSDGIRKLIYTMTRSIGPSFSPTSGDLTFVAYGAPWDPGVENYDVRMIDMNGDGLDDRLTLSLQPLSTSNAEAELYLSTGVGFQESPAASSFVGVAGESFSVFGNLYTLDTDEDGYADLLYPDSSTSMAVQRFTGDAFASPESTTISPGSGFGNGVNLRRVMDMDGDGNPDHLNISASGSVVMDHRTEPFQAADVIRKITDGLGHETIVHYTSITDPDATHFTPGNATDTVAMTYGNGSPVFDMYMPWYLVERVEMSAPAAGVIAGTVDADAKREMRYEYAAPRSQSGGRGFLGFATRTEVDDATGLRTVTHSHQDFPLSGLPESIETWALNGEMVSRAQYSYTDDAAPGLARRPYASSVTEESFDLQGIVTVPLVSVATTQVQDELGQVTSMTVQTTDHAGLNYTLTTSNEYLSENEADWHLRRVETSTVTHNRNGQNRQRVSSFGYHATTGLLNLEILEPLGAPEETLQMEYEHDAYGNVELTRTSGFDGATTQQRERTATFDASGRFANETYNALGELVESVVGRDAAGRPTRVLNQQGTAFESVYDVMGTAFFTRNDTGGFARNLRTLDVTGCPLESAYKVESTSAGGSAAFTCHDLLGRTVRSASQGFGGQTSGIQYSYVDTEYDSAGRVLRISEPYFENAAQVHWTTTSYDDLGRPTLIAPPGIAPTTIEYDQLTETTTDPTNAERIDRKNGLGEVVHVEDAIGGTITYEYDPLGNVERTEVTPTDADVDPVEILAVHDKFGRRTSMNDPDMGTWAYEYNAFGELIRQTDAKGQNITMRYDQTGRMLERRDYAVGANHGDDDAADMLTEWIWANGLLAAEYHTRRDDTAPAGSEFDNPHFSRLFLYDIFGRTVETQTEIYGTQYVETQTYDQFGRPFQQFDASGDSRGIQYEYNSRGYLTGIVEAQFSGDGNPVAYQTIGDRDARGNITDLLRHGLAERRTYAPDTGRLERIEAWAGEDDTHPDLVHLTYLHDDVGNLKERSNLLGGAGTENFEYDALHRLIEHQRTGAADVDIHYDGLGNIRLRTDVGTYTYDDDDRPHAVRSAGGRTYDYDANGAMTQRNGQTVDYGIHHKPTRMNHSGGRSTLIEYGPNRERFRRTDLDLSGPDDLYTYVGNVEFIIRGAVPEVRRNLPGGVVINHAVQAPETSVVFSDHLGSPVVITNTAGIPQQDQSFDAWGRRRAEDGSPLTDAEIQGFNTDHTTTGLTGHEMLDPTVLVHMNGRVYEPTIGRFLSPDPFIQAPRNTQSFNRYSYVWNNPLSYTDPSGYFCDECPPTTIRTFRPLLESHGALFGFDPQQAFKNRTAQFAGAFSTSGTRRAVMGMRSGQVPWLEDWGRSTLPERALGALPFTSVSAIADLMAGVIVGTEGVESCGDDPFCSVPDAVRDLTSLSKLDSLLEKVRELVPDSGVVSFGIEFTGVIGVVGGRFSSGVYVDLATGDVGLYRQTGGGITGVEDAIAAGIEVSAASTVDYTTSMQAFEGTTTVLSGSVPAIFGADYGIAESGGYAIGLDSGFGALASVVRVDTVSESILPLFQGEAD